MSIWCTRIVLSSDHCCQDCDEDGPAPITYRGSHILPSDDDPRGGILDTASIPPWITRDGRCVLGCDTTTCCTNSDLRSPCCEDGDGGPYWPWLRLAVRPEQRPTHAQWTLLHSHACHVEAEHPDLAAAIRAAADAEDTIILDAAQVDALIADLTGWRANVDEEKR